MVRYNLLFDEPETELAFEALYKYVKNRYYLFPDVFGSQYGTQSDWDVLCTYLSPAKRYPISNITTKGLLTKVMGCPYCKQPLGDYDINHYRKAMVEVNTDFIELKELQEKVHFEYENDTNGFLFAYKELYDKKARSEVSETL